MNNTEEVEQKNKKNVKDILQSSSLKPKHAALFMLVMAVEMVDAYINQPLSEKRD